MGYGDPYPEGFCIQACPVTIYFRNGRIWFESCQPNIGPEFGSCHLWLLSPFFSLLKWVHTAQDLRRYLKLACVFSNQFRPEP